MLLCNINSFHKLFRFTTNSFLAKGSCVINFDPLSVDRGVISSWDEFFYTSKTHYSLETKLQPGVLILHENN